MEARPLETQVLRACLDYLTLRGIFHWRANQGVIPTPNGSYRRFVGLRGVADILGVLQTGRFLAVEVKRPGGRLSDEQKTFLGRVAELGGVACCVSSIEELEVDLKEAGVF